MVKKQYKIIFLILFLAMLMICCYCFAKTNNVNVTNSKVVQEFKPLIKELINPFLFGVRLFASAIIWFLRFAFLYHVIMAKSIPLGFRRALEWLEALGWIKNFIYGIAITYVLAAIFYSVVIYINTGSVNINQAISFATTLLKWFFIDPFIELSKYIGIKLP